MLSLHMYIMTKMEKLAIIRLNIWLLSFYIVATGKGSKAKTVLLIYDDYNS